MSEVKEHVKSQLRKIPMSESLTEDRKGILIRTPKGIWKELSRLALEQETTLNALGIQGFELVLDQAKMHHLVPPPPPPSNINFAVLHEAYEQFKTLNCPPEIHKSRVKRNKWRIENPFPYDGTNWVPRYTPMLSNTGKTIRGWHIEYHGDDGRQVDNDPYRNSRNQRNGAGRDYRAGLEWERTRAIGLDQETVVVPTADIHAVLNVHDRLLAALKMAEQVISAVAIEVEGYASFTLEEVRAAIAEAEGR